MLGIDKSIYCQYVAHRQVDRTLGARAVTSTPRTRCPRLEPSIPSDLTSGARAVTSTPRTRCPRLEPSIPSYLTLGARAVTSTLRTRCPRLEPSIPSDLTSGARAVTSTPRTRYPRLEPLRLSPAPAPRSPLWCHTFHHVRVGALFPPSSVTAVHGALFFLCSKGETRAHHREGRTLPMHRRPNLHAFGARRYTHPCSSSNECNPAR
jgi:hypothetical protein